MQLLTQGHLRVIFLASLMLAGADEDAPFNPM